MRSIEEIIEVAMKKTKQRLREKQPKEIVVRKTGNRRALHQKSKNRRTLWKD